VFDDACLQEFMTLKKQLVSAPKITTLILSLPFELMCDASDYVVGAVLGKRKDKEKTKSFPHDLTFQQRKKFLHDVKSYF